MLKKITPRTRLKLPRLTNSEFEHVADLARKLGHPLTQCPTCGAREQPIDENTYGWENGTYLLDSKEVPCDCETQMDLWVHYLRAGIPTQYQRLDWKDYTGSEQVREDVAMYLERWPIAKLNGMGVEFSSPNLGVGKTFAATYIGKELVKQGERVLFMEFLEIIGLLSKEQAARSAAEQRLHDATVLILDEVRPASTGPQHELFSRQFEELIRYRTNFNLPTIMTTNLTPDELRSEYPRPYSLLEAKQIRIEMKGADARIKDRSMRNIELLANGEVEPLT